VRSLFVAVALALALFGAACSSPPPPRPPMETEKVEAPPASQKNVKIQVSGVITFVVEAATATADDPSLVRIYGQPNAIAVVGQKIGRTTLHIQTKKGSTEDVNVEVASGEPLARALAIGETHSLSMKGVKEYSVGLHDIVATAPTSDGTQLLVTGKKPGSTTILMIGKDGKSQKHQIVVVGGDRIL
jgi:hypothetical protein